MNSSKSGMCSPDSMGGMSSSLFPLKRNIEAPFCALIFEKLLFNCVAIALSFFFIFHVKIVDIKSRANHPLPSRIKDGIPELGACFLVP